eukprot:m.252561 g.252561  ORF g.252561 m.252561 type:complete len:50 (-) comp16155_c0_seq28:1868-2017(-)
MQSQLKDFTFNENLDCDLQLISSLRLNLGTVTTHHPEERLHRSQTKIVN